MKNKFYLILLSVLSISIFLTSCGNTTTEQRSQTDIEIVDGTDSISYSIGADIGDNLINQGIDINYDAFNAGFKNGYAKKTHVLTLEDRKELFRSMQERMRAKQQTEASASLQKAEKFLKDNKSQNKDIQETKSGLQYRIIKKGSGKSPDSSSDPIPLLSDVVSSSPSQSFSRPRACVS